jgi:ADP-heptose:LPS heptosyltransferase
MSELRSVSGGAGALRRVERAPVIPAEVRRVLLIQTYGLGDVLLTTPVIRALARAFPGVQIDYVSHAPGCDALTGNPYLTEIRPIATSIGAQLALMWTLRRARYDVVLDLLSNPRSAQLAWATGAPARIGIRGRGPRNHLYTLILPRETPQVYSARQKLRFLEPLGIDPASVEDVSLDITIGPAEHAWAAEVFERLGLTGGAPVVAVSPVSKESYKQWGAERWAAVADRIAESGARVLLTNGPSEREQAEAVVQRMRMPVAWDYGPTTVRQLAALFARCALWVGNDGGAKHVAVAAGVPTVTVIRWGIGEIWTELGAALPHVSIERAPPQGCDRRCTICPHRGCLSAITPEEVAGEVAALLERTVVRRG